MLISMSDPLSAARPSEESAEKLAAAFAAALHGSSAPGFNHVAEQVFSDAGHKGQSCVELAELAQYALQKYLSDHRWKASDDDA